MDNEIEKYLQIKADIEQACRQARKAKRDEHRASRSFRIDKKVFWLGVVAPSVLAVLLAPAGLIESLRWMFYVSWGLIAVSYLVLFIYPMLCLWLYRDSLKKAFAAPFASLINANVKTVMLIDAGFIPALMALSNDTLKLGALELKSERSGFEKRTHLVTGALEKVGIFPGLLALAVGLTTLAKTLAGTDLLTARLDWVFAVAAANIFFYLLCGYAQTTLVRYDRMIALTELAVERKKAQLDS